MVISTNIISDIICDKGLVNRTLVKRLITKILAYSAIKISANNPLLYSVLNPDTSSDSPSAKSKGVRFVSARFVINQIKNRGGIKNNIHVVVFILVKSIDIRAINVVNRIKDILTS
jgi:hypothetical protein